MARSFPGPLSATDRIEFGTTSSSVSAFSMAFWLKVDVLDTGSGARAFSHQNCMGIICRDDASDGFMWFHNTETSGSFNVNWPEMATGVWVSVVLIHDGTTGTPDCYYDGVLQTATVNNTPTGTDWKSFTDATLFLGNNSTLARCIDGSIADYAWWWGYELTAADAVAHAAGFRANMLGGQKPTWYLPLLADSLIDPYGATATVTGTTVVADDYPINQPSSQILHPPERRLDVSGTVLGVDYTSPTASWTMHMDASDTDNLYETSAIPPTTTPSDGDAVEQWDAETLDLAFTQTGSTLKPLYRAAGMNSIRMT